MIKKTKNLRYVLLILLISASPLWAVWEGNAGIASAGDFPGPGLFARSDMFPKNTLVEIKNLETEISVRAVITGPSGVPGLVAVLSPETASALSVRLGSVSRVRISIPSAVAEAAARGTIGGSTDSVSSDPDSNPSVATASANIIEDSSTDDLLASFVEEEPELAEELELAQEPELAQEAIEPFLAEKPLFEEPIQETFVSAVESAPPVPESLEESVVSEVLPPAEPEFAEAVSNTYFAEPELTLANDDSFVDEDVLDIEEEIAVAIVENDNEYATEVTLVPAAERPPVVELIEQNDPVPVVSSIIEPAIIESEIMAPVAVVAPVQASLNKSVTPTTTLSPSDIAQLAPANSVSTVTTLRASVTSNDLPLITSFAKGSYYIQIASYSDSRNARKLVDDWGSKYPVVVESSVTTKGEILKVFIGPVQKDEYGAVLERFRLLGFNDAFVKKE